MVVCLFISVSGCYKIESGIQLTQVEELQGRAEQEKDSIEKKEEIILPDPKMKGEISLEEAFSSRRSDRHFQQKDLELEHISQILWAAQGITESSRGFRTAPSAGALYTLELFVVKSDGLFHYIPADHKLEKLSPSDFRSDLMKASLFQESISEAPAVIVIAAVFERTTVKYGERGVRYVYMEAGHACQNILLEATALGLGAVPIGAFSDNEVQKALSLQLNCIPLYVIPVGYKK